MTAATYFITGASGFVGRHLCQRLTSSGHLVRGLARRLDNDCERAYMEVIPGDITEPGPWQAKAADADFVIHCAAIAVFRGGRAYTAVNVEGTRNVVSAARQAGPRLRRFVHVSTIGAIDRAASDNCTRPLDESSPPAPKSEYGRSKAAAEQIVLRSGLPFSIVRPTMVVGGDMREGSHFSMFARMAAKNTLFARLAWPGAFSVVHVDDLAAALELCATHHEAVGRTFFCAGSAVTLNECFERVRPNSARLPLGWAARIARAMPALTPFRAKALLLPALTASDASLRRLGWAPRQSDGAILSEVVVRESARANPELDPGGQTVITGAASGLGRALVDRLAPKRRNLLLIDRDPAGLQQAKARFPHCRVAVADLADDKQISGLTQTSEWRELPITELFACAGLGARGPVLDVPTQKHRQLFQVNVLARLSMSHSVLPDMIRRQFGRIVFVSSSSAFQPLPYMATYAASNAALLSMGEAWAAELEGTGVQMLLACPGGMQTNFQSSAGVKVLPSERLMSPADVADRIVRSFAQRKTVVMISARAVAMSLLARLLPRATSTALWKKLMTRLR